MQCWSKVKAQKIPCLCSPAVQWTPCCLYYLLVSNLLGLGEFVQLEEGLRFCRVDLQDGGVLHTTNNYISTYWLNYLATTDPTRIRIYFLFFAKLKSVDVKLFWGNVPPSCESCNDHYKACYRAFHKLPQK